MRFLGAPMAQPDNQPWHLDRKVPVTIILVLVMQGVAGLWVIADIEKDVEILKAAQWAQRERDTRQDVASAEALNLVRNDIKELGQKLDRLIESKARQ